MKKHWQKGASNLSGILIIAVIVVIMLGQSGGSKSGSSLGWGTGTTISSGGGSGLFSSQSLSSGGSEPSKLTIGTGNASYAMQSYEEYITLDNSGRSAVNITGWQLKNGKDKRPYYTGSALQRFSADVVVIPKAALVLSPTGESLNQDVILKSGERAILTTGSLGSRSPYQITSFKENMCTGYLEDLPDYNFIPSLSRNCLAPENEPGFENLDVPCRKIVERLNRCETPQIGERRSGEEYCPDCYQGQLLSSHCKAFLVEHFSYKGCLAYHQGDSNFAGKTWRLFLNRGWEMWAKDYETIELFDRNGTLVNYQNY